MAAPASSPVALQEAAQSLRAQVDALPGGYSGQEFLATLEAADLHIWVTGAGTEHEASPACPCGPSARDIEHEDGTPGVLYIHPVATLRAWMTAEDYPTS